MPIPFASVTTSRSPWVWPTSAPPSSRPSHCALISREIAVRAVGRDLDGPIVVAHRLSLLVVISRPRQPQPLRPAERPGAARRGGLGRRRHLDRIHGSRRRESESRFTCPTWCIAAVTALASRCYRPSRVRRRCRGGSGRPVSFAVLLRCPECPSDDRDRRQIEKRRNGTRCWLSRRLRGSSCAFARSR